MGEWFNSITTTTTINSASAIGKASSILDNIRVRMDGGYLFGSLTQLNRENFTHNKQH